MNYGSGTDVTRRRPIARLQREMTSWPPSWKYDVISKMRLRQSMRIYLMNKNCAKFHPRLIWNDRVLGFLRSVLPTRRKWFQISFWSKHSDAVLKYYLFTDYSYLGLFVPWIVRGTNRPVMVRIVQVPTHLYTLCRLRACHTRRRFAKSQYPYEDI